MPTGLRAWSGTSWTAVPAPTQLALGVTPPAPHLLPHPGLSPHGLGLKTTRLPFHSQSHAILAGDVANFSNSQNRQGKPRLTTTIRRPAEQLEVESPGCRPLQRSARAVSPGGPEVALTGAHSQKAKPRPSAAESPFAKLLAPRWAGRRGPGRGWRQSFKRAPAGRSGACEGGPQRWRPPGTTPEPSSGECGASPAQGHA